MPSTIVRRLLCAALALATGLAQSQPKPDAPPKFDVASIKLCTGPGSPAPLRPSPGRLHLTCWPVRRLIQEAYDLFADGKVNPLNPVFTLVPVEGPDWIDSARYLIDAKTEGPQSQAMMRGPMMRTLLEDRFHLKVHRETRQVPVFAMSVAKGGLKLQPTKEGSCEPFNPLDLTQSPNRAPGEKPWCVMSRPIRNGSHFVFDARGMSLDMFAKLLGGLDRPVIDRTGIAGAFDIHVEFAPGADAGEPEDPASGVSITTALRQQLGLRLDPAIGPREFLVIDSMQRPSEN